MSVGKFGQHSGQFVPETLMSAAQELEAAHNKYSKNLELIAELDDLHKNYTDRPSLLYYVEEMTKDLGGVKIYLKREDLDHTGSHRINNALGQVLLAKKTDKTHVIAKTDAGQHGMTTAIIATLPDMGYEVFVGEEGIDRQALSVLRIQLLGVKVHSVTGGTQILKNTVNETTRKWTDRVGDTHCVLGSVMSPHPFPTTVRDSQSIIGRETREQFLKAERKLLGMVIACVGGGNNAMGVLYEFTNELSVALVGCETAGKGVEAEQHAATICKGFPDIFHGTKFHFCQDEHGQTVPIYSISAELDHPGIGPRCANLHGTGRASHVPTTDDEAVDAFQYLSRTEGIIPATESAHVVSYVGKVALGMSKDDIIVINLSGRGDKDVAAIARYMGMNIYEQSQ